MWTPSGIMWTSPAEMGTALGGMWAASGGMSEFAFGAMFLAGQDRLRDGHIDWGTTKPVWLSQSGVVPPHSMFWRFKS